MPYPTEHAARIKEPDLFIIESFRRKVIDKGIITIIGRLVDGDDSMIIQAYRFDKEYFTVVQAKKWLKNHDIEYISFEPASESENGRSFERSPNESEYRIIDSSMCQYECRYTKEGEKQEYISGMGIVYNAETEILPGVFESIRPGAFSKSLNRFNEVKSFINHDPSLILSTTRSTPPLEITDNENSLVFVSPIPPTSYGRDLAINVNRGNISGASFSFMIHDNGELYSIDDEGNYHREIISAEIYEVGPVTNPAYQQTTVSLRNKESILKNIELLKPSPKRDESELNKINNFLSLRKGL